MTLRPLQETGYRRNQPLLDSLQLNFTAEGAEGVLLPEEAVRWWGGGLLPTGASVSDLSSASQCPTATIPELIEKFAGH